MYRPPFRPRRLVLPLVLTIPIHAPSEPAPMAAKKKVKRNPAPAKSTKPDPALVKEVSAEVCAQLEAVHASREAAENPPGVSTGDGSPVVLGAAGGRFGGLFARLDLKKLVPKLTGAVIEGLGMMADGKLSPDEARRAVGIVVDMVKEMVAQMAGDEDTPPDVAPAA
jgi:hypothetical protein